MAEPQDITKNPDGSVVVLEWAEAGAAVEPSAGRKSTGELPLDLYTSNEHNWLDREPMRWLRALFSRYVNASEGLGGSYLVPNGAGVWSTNGVAALEGFLSDAPAGPDVLVADVWLDAAGGGAVRVQVSVPKGGPKTFLATRDTYVFVPWDLIVPPTVSLAELTFVDVPVGDPMPPIPIGTVGIWRVETDGVTIVDQEILVPTFPIMKTVGFETVRALSMMISGTLDVDGLARLNDTDFLSGAAVNVETGSTLTIESGGELAVASGGVLTAESGGTLRAVDGATVELLGDGTLGTSAANTWTVNSGSQFNEDIDGHATKKLTIGRVALVSASTTIGEVGRSGDDLVYNDGTLKRAWVTAAGFAAAEGRQEATTGLTVGGTVVPKTVSKVAPKVGDLIVRAGGQLQGSVVGNMTIQLQQGDGAGVFSDLGNPLVIDSVDDSDADIWTTFTIERLALAPGATPRDYRVKVTNGFSVAQREGTIYVWSRPT